MIFKSKEIYQFFHGSVSCEETELGVVPYRFPIDFWDYITDPGYSAASLAGIYLAVDTDASEFSLKYQATQRSDFSLPAFTEAFFDGEKLCEVDSPEEYREEETTRRDPDDPGKLIYALPSKDALTISAKLPHPGRLEIYFPIGITAAFSSFELGGATYCRPIPEKNKRCLWLGDSISQGYSVKHPSDTWAVRTAKEMDWELTNQGIGGYSFRRDFPHIQPFTPDVIIVALGTNDPGFEEPWKRDTVGFFEELYGLWPDVPTAVITPLWRESLLDPEMTRAIYNDIVRCTKGHKNTLFIDGGELLPHDLTYYVDGVHPNEQGVAVLTEKLSGILRSNRFGE